jgi:amidase
MRQTDGSILSPAGRNNVVGLKPTTGLVSRDAVIPISYKQDTVGPFTRTVKDSAHILTLIAGKSQADPRTDGIPFETIPDYAKSCQGTDLTGIRIGVPRNAFPGIGPVEDKAFTKALETLSLAGAHIVEDANFLAAEEYEALPDSDKSVVIHADFKLSLANYLKSLETNPNNLHSLQDLIDYTKTHAGEEYPARNVAQFDSAQSIDVESQEYKDIAAREQYIAGDGGIIGVLKRHNVDVLAVPTPADIAVAFSAIAGTPVISIPLGFLPADTPVKKDSKSDLISSGPNFPYVVASIRQASLMIYRFPICFFAAHYEEQILIRIAHAFERLTSVRNNVQPYMVPKTELRSE